jgi:hypothetical protein
MTKPTPRKHHAMMCRYAMDNRLLCWFWNPNFTYWQQESQPAWEDEFIYFVGHEKPTQPPKHMCELGGISFPAPESVAPASGTLVYTPCLRREGQVYLLKWSNCLEHLWLIESNLVHLNSEAAALHSQGLAAVNLAAVRGEIK